VVDLTVTLQKWSYLSEGRRRPSLIVISQAENLERLNECVSAFSRQLMFA
jgi:hypothetical protein